MPNWKVHLEIGNKVNEKLNNNINDSTMFLFGSVLPDVNNGYLVKDVSKVISHGGTHYSGEIFKGYKIFYEKYAKEIRINPLFQGYFAHLITDFFWNNYFYADFYKKNKEELKELNREELRILKQDDFKIYDSLFYKDVIEGADDDKILESAKKINEISINKKDVKNVLEYIKKNANIVPEKKEFKVLKKEDLDKLMNDTIKYIYKTLEDIKSNNEVFL